MVQEGGCMVSTEAADGMPVADLMEIATRKPDDIGDRVGDSGKQRSQIAEPAVGEGV